MVVLFVTGFILFYKTSQFKYMSMGYLKIKYSTPNPRWVVYKHPINQFFKKRKSIKKSDSLHTLFFFVRVVILTKN